MKSDSSNKSATQPEEKEVAARIILKPVVHRHWKSIRLVEFLLRPIAKVLDPATTPQTLGAQTILIFDPGALGDMMMLVPFLQNLRSWFPTSQIALLGRPGPGQLLLDRGLIHEFISIPIPWSGRSSRWNKNNPFSTKWISFIRNIYALRKRSFDLAYATGWSNDLRGNLVIWLAGARRRIGYGYAGGRFLLTEVVAPDLLHPHVVDRNLNLLKHLAIPPPPNDALPLSESAKTAATSFLARHSIRREDLVVGIHPGAGSPVREWGDQRFAEIARQLTTRFGARILWFVDPNQPKALPLNVDAVPLSLSLSELEAVLSHCSLFICNDSGPMHLASALKVPVVAIFGPQRPEWFGPWGTDLQKVVIRQDMWCRPCGDNCIFDQPYCLDLIPVEQVMHEVEATIKSLPHTSKPVEARR
jgi:heptosyltransferase-2